MITRDYTDPGLREALLSLPETLERKMLGKMNQMPEDLAETYFSPVCNKWPFFLDDCEMEL